MRGRANVFSQDDTHTAPSQIERGAALREWLALADAIVDAGAAVAVLPWDDDDDTLTGMPYTAEAGALGKNVWLLPNITPPHRRGEAARIELLARAWERPTHQVPVPWEGQGDVVDVGAAGSPRYVCTSGEGRFARTSIEAFERVAPYLDGPAIHVRFRADPWFHGNTFLGCYRGARERVIIACDEALFDGERARIEKHAGDGARWFSISRDESLKYATNALLVGKRVLAPAGVPQRVHEVWRALGLDIVEVALPTLFGKGGGAAVCLTNKLALAPKDVPAAYRYETVRAKLAAAASAGAAARSS